MERKTSGNFLNPSKPLYHKASRGFQWLPRHLMKRGKNWRNHEKRRKTEKNGDILRYEIFQKWPKAASLLGLSWFYTIREFLILPKNRLKCLILLLTISLNPWYYTGVRRTERQTPRWMSDDPYELIGLIWDLGNQSHDCQNTVAWFPDNWI